MVRRKKQVRLTTEDPALVALNRIAAMLEPFSRTRQLRIMASACIAVGEFAHARAFLNVAEAES